MFHPIILKVPYLKAVFLLGRLVWGVARLLSTILKLNIPARNQATGHSLLIYRQQSLNLLNCGAAHQHTLLTASLASQQVDLLSRHA
jgi:hypothetical protein